MTEAHGHVEPGWGKVADAFRTNFDDGKELGAACAVYHRGRPVVDLWAGVADATTGRPWEEDTVVLVFSTTKGLTALLAHRLVERGLLDLDAPVASYWPEFAANGKAHIPVRWLLSHQVGLTRVDRPLTLDDLCAWEPVVEALAAQAPLWEPGEQHAYHALTFGWLVGEVLRRITGKTPGTLLAEEVSGPLGLSTWIGLPEEIEPRVARIEPAPPIEDEALRGVLDLIMGEGSSFHDAILGMPIGLVTPDGGGFGSRQVRAAEIPAGNMVSDARSLARAYAAMVGEVDGIRLLQPATVEAARVVQTTTSTSWGMPAGFEAFGVAASLGFAPPNDAAPLLGPTSVGHGGAGGSIGVAEVEHELGFGYVMNQMRTEIPNRPRNQLLMDAAAACAAEVA